MEEFALWLAKWLLIWFVAIPALTLIHELGHALPTIAFSDSGSRVSIGAMQGPLLVDKHIGPMHLRWYPAFPFTGMAYPDRRITRRTSLIMLAGGPLFTLIALLALIAFDMTTDLGAFVDEGVFDALISFSFVALLLSIIPMKYPTRSSSGELLASDAYHIVQLLLHPDWTSWKPDDIFAAADQQRQRPT